MQKRLLATVLGISKPGRSWGHSASQVPGEESTIRGHDVVSRAETRSYQPQEGNTRAISECPGVQVLTGQRGVGRQAGRHQLPGKDSVSWKLVTGNQGKWPSL